MRIPGAPSSHYRKLGWKPVYCWGMVLWLRPEQYVVIRSSDMSSVAQDATDEQIQLQDEWYEYEQEQAEIERKRWAEMIGMFRASPAPASAPDTQDGGT
jgi:hypothetical protein